MSANVKILAKAELEGRDLIQWLENAMGETSVHFIGCRGFSEAVLRQKKQSVDPRQWSLHFTDRHEDRLLNEFIRKCKGEWDVVYEHAELCHCRVVPTQVVEQAILAGASTSEEVSRWTSASTSCGTCRPDVEKILAKRLA